MNPFRHLKPNDMRAIALERAERQLVEAALGLEEFRAHVAMLEARILRLKAELHLQRAAAS